MSTPPSPFTYRRRLGRAPSPPTWAWYEQIPIEDDESETDSVEDDSCSEDDEDYGHRDQQDRDCDHSSDESSTEDSDSPNLSGVHINANPREGQDVADQEDKDDEQDQEGEVDPGAEKMEVDGGETREKKDLKGKQRAVEPDVQESSRRRERKKKQRQPVFTFRPILTIQKSQGFVWNQDLFVPPYIKDRYVASTSPPTYGSSSSLNVNDYEVDVVEIRVKEGEFANIIP